MFDTSMLIALPRLPIGRLDPVRYPTCHHVIRSSHSPTDGEFHSDHSVTIRQNVAGDLQRRADRGPAARGPLPSAACVHQQVDVTSAPRMAQNSVSGQVNRNSPRSQNHW